jgi:hypothetical protein
MGGLEEGCLKRDEWVRENSRLDASTVRGGSSVWKGK